jgi:hypothetical protein
METGGDFPYCTFIKRIKRLYKTVQKALQKTELQR